LRKNQVQREGFGLANSGRAGAIPTGRASRKRTDRIPVAVTSAERLGARKSESVREAHGHPDGGEAIGCIRGCQEIGRVTAVRSLMLEILNRPLVRLCRTTRGERSEILTLSGLSVLFARIQTISASLQFSNHWTILVGPKQVASACPAPGRGTTAC
jgi:hypothetical protein